MEDSPSKRRRKSKLKEITATLSKDELIRRLKFNAQTLAHIEQGVEETSIFDNLAAALVTTTILRHKDKDVRLYAATCLADLLSLYAPEPPYDEDQLRDIFRLILQQLKGLDNISGPSYKRHFYILESLAIVKSFSVCLDLDDPELIVELFKLFFTVVSPDHNARVAQHMLDIMAPLIQDAESLSQDVLDAVLVHLVEPRKSKCEAAYKLACDLIDRVSHSIEPYVQIFFNNVLVLGNQMVPELEGRIYDLIYELFKVNKNVLISALPQLEFKLKGNEETSRLETVRLLCKMFAYGDVSLAASNKALWQCYLGRFLDISANVRTACIQMAEQFLTCSSQPLRADITEQLLNRCLDPDEKVRMETVMTICEAAKKDFNLIDKKLLDAVSERMRDKKVSIRIEAIGNMGRIYKNVYLNSPQNRQEVSWIPTKVLHLYQNTVEDRLCIERVYHGCFIPVPMEAEERMQRLLHMFLSLDEIAVKVLERMLKVRAKINADLNDLLDAYKGTDENRQNIIFSKRLALARRLPDPVRAQEHLKKLPDLCKDSKFYQLMKTCTDTSQECPKMVKAATDIMKTLTAKSQIQETIKNLLDRACSMLIDSNSFILLLRYIKKYIEGVSDNDLDDDDMDEDEMMMKGTDALKLIQILSDVQPCVFYSQQTFEILLVFIKHTSDTVVESTLKTLEKVIDELHTVNKSLLSCYQPVLTKLATNGTYTQAKYAVRCLYKMNKDSSLSTERLFKEKGTSQDVDVKNQSLLDNMNFDLTDSRLRSCLAALGEVALLDPELFDSEMKTIVKAFVVKEVLMRDWESESSSQDDNEWCADEDVTEQTLVKLEAIKLLTKWLLGLEEVNESKTGPVFRLLTSFLEQDGDLTNNNEISAPSRSRLRLAAGCAMLKLLQNKNIVDLITVEQYHQLGFLIQDSCVEVREEFTDALNKGLNQLQLPYYYMAYFALVAIDPVKQRKVKVKQMILQNAQIRRDYVKTHSTAADRPFSILPEYSLPYVVHLLAHHQDLDVEDFEKLAEFKEYLWFFLEQLMGPKAENYSFLKKLIENIKQTKDKLDPDNSEANQKLYVICDLAVACIMNKEKGTSQDVDVKNQTSSFTLKDFPGNPVLPKKLFVEEKNMVNTRSYLPKGFVVSPKKSQKQTEVIKALSSKEKASPKKGQGTKRAKSSADSDDEVEATSPKKKTRVAPSRSPTKRSPKKTVPKTKSPTKSSPKKSPVKSRATKKSKAKEVRRSPKKSSPVKKNVKKTTATKEKRQLKMDAFVNGGSSSSNEEQLVSSVNNESDDEEEEVADERSPKNGAISKRLRQRYISYLNFDVNVLRRKTLPKKSPKKSPAKLSTRNTRVTRNKGASPVKMNGTSSSEEFNTSTNSSQTSIVSDEKPSKLMEKGTSQDVDVKNQIRRRKQRTKR